MSKRLAQTVILAAVLALPACVGGGEPPGTRFAQVAAQLPPVPPDRTRFFFYDMPPGTYVISVPYSAIYPYKDKTVTVGPGQTVFAKIQSEKFEPNITLLDYQPDIFVVVLVDSAQARQEIADKRYFP